MWFRILPRATINAIAIVAVCFIVYIVFFHKYDPTANNIAAYEIKQVEITRARGTR
jgi:hypothetical protein